MGGDLSQFEMFFQDMAVPRFIMQVPKKGEPKVSHINTIALKYFDMSAEQIIGQSVERFMDQGNAQHFTQSFEVACSHKKSVTIQSLPGVPGEVRVYGFYISPIMNSKGDIEYLDIIGQLDVTDQAILQRERDDAISLLTSVFDVSEIGIIVTDTKGKIVRVNESFIRTYGWGRDELINTDMGDLVTPDERGAIQKIQEECMKTGRHHSGELKIIRKDGNVASILSTTATLELSQKRRYQVITAMDITLRKRMEESLLLAKEQADAANRAKSTFLANMSHELRTPLNAIIGFSEMMMKETFGPLKNDKYAEYMGDVHDSARHLLEIINEVLDMAKIEAGRVEMDEEEVDLKELIQSASRMMASRAFTDNIEIKVVLAEDLPKIKADERLIRQALINLIGNAVKFSKAGDHIQIEAAFMKDQSVQIKVIDQGIGIPREKIKQALTPFGQILDRPENALYQGTGLGLPLAKAMIELHDGIFQIESDAGQGTTVIISFPDYRTLPKS